MTTGARWITLGLGGWALGAVALAVTGIPRLAALIMFGGSLTMMAGATSMWLEKSEVEP